MPRIPEPPATLRLALVEFCKTGGVLLVDTFSSRPTVVAWSQGMGPPPACIDYVPRIENKT
jgi:hypothetical protein